MPCLTPARRSFRAAPLFLALALPLAAQAEVFHAKTGAWEMTTTTVTTGMLMPADKLAQMPPEQRAKFEAAMKARSGQARTHTRKSCVTQKDLDQDRLLKPEEGESKCTRKVVSKSAGKLVIEQACPAPHASTAQIVFESKTPETMVATIDMAQGGAAGKVHVDITGRWLGASCAGIKDE